MSTELRRLSDQGILCWLALRFSQFWDFIDKRDIDKHAMAWAMFAGSAWIVWWATHFVSRHPDRPGLELAAIIAAVMIPWTPVQAAVTKWYFDARPSVETKP